MNYFVTESMCTFYKYTQNGILYYFELEKWYKNLFNFFKLEEDKIESTTRIEINVI